MHRRWGAPEPGDIVWCHFPQLPDPAPGPKPRPALVTEVTEREDGLSVTVAYGTSQRLDRLFKGEFAITRQAHPAAYRTAGLSFDTKFHVGRTVELPWTEDFFAVPPGAPHGQCPKLGALHASMMRSAQAAFASVR